MRRTKYPDESKVAYLDILCWAFSLGGEHYIATLNINGEREKVEYAMTKGQAIKFNKKDQVSFYEKGHTTTRFWKEADAIKAAVNLAKQKCPDLKLMIEGDGLLQPHIVHYCADKAVKVQLDEMARQMEAMYKKSSDPWRSFGEDVVEHLCQCWLNVLIRYLGVKKPVANRKASKKPCST